MRTAGPPAGASASTTGAAASVRSPEKPAAQPTRRMSSRSLMKATVGSALPFVNSKVKIDSSESQMNLSTRQLRAFVALAEERSFTRAAALMHLSQPAFSALVRSLEESLEQRLFDRTTRHVELSTEGRAFEPAARRILAEVEGALTSARDYAARRRGRVAIALLPSLAAGWLPALLAQFRAAHPGIELE